MTGTATATPDRPRTTRALIRVAVLDDHCAAVARACIDERGVVSSGQASGARRAACGGRRAGSDRRISVEELRLDRLVQLAASRSRSTSAAIQHRL